MPEPAAADAGASAGAANAATIERFYAALGRRDAEAMLACYAPDVRFSDPVFPDLDAAGVAAMWRMLTSRGKDLQVVASDIAADATTGRARWVATYTYSANGRRVENRIDATFAFRDGRIVRHQDRFDLYRWARQALGPLGALLGWLPPMQRVIRRQAAAALAAWQKKNPAGPPPAR
jgi:ketosteroid isomerase-like protein